MRDTTDMLVNAILRLRRLLKQRQSAEDPASSGAHLTIPFYVSPGCESFLLLFTSILNLHPLQM